MDLIYELLESFAFGLLVGVLIGIMLAQTAVLVWLFWDMFIRKDMK